MLPAKTRQSQRTGAEQSLTPKTVVITGGAGFIGSNVAAVHLERGDRVRIFDNLSRAGTDRNWDWLETLPGQLRQTRGDIRERNSLAAAVTGADIVYHLAGQVAVTTSVTDPRSDFEINCFGTFNVLEAVREHCPGAIVLYASTNKVYGGMEDTDIILDGDHYRYRDLPGGVPETMPLDFHSPYGCSKGAGDQYVRDYARIYGLRTVVFRQSCIYGVRQFGNEDQGWVAHFLRRALAGEQISIFGDGYQVRDVLWVGDLVDCYLRAIDRIDEVAGMVFNVGGGPGQTVSLRDVLAALEHKIGLKIDLRFDEWRPGDQRVYVSDVTLAGKQLGWKPSVPVDEGLQRLLDWTRSDEGR